MDLQEFFQINWFSISIFIFMTIVFIANYRVEQQITKKFITPIVLLTIAMILENIDTIMFNNSNTSVAHTIISILSYTILLMVLIALAHIILQNDNYDYKKIMNILLIISISVGVVIIVLAFATNWVFWYDIDTGETIKRPLAYIPHLIFLLYMIFLCYIGYKRIKMGHIEEGAIILTGVGLSICGVSAETLLNTNGIIISTTALFITFYYLYLHIQIFKTDTLTGCLNRMTMKADSLKYKHKLKALIMIDLNNLKELNDNHGHDKGDLALKTLAKTVKHTIPSDCRLYRSGGDEFVLFIPNNIKETVKDIEQNINKAMKETDYTWATGSAEFTEIENDFEIVLKTADCQMYNTKTRMKQGRTS